MSLQQKQTTNILDGKDSSNSYAMFQLAKEWLRTCVDSHTECQARLISGVSLPSRLIDLGPGEVVEPRIRLAADLPSNLTYATLSHCWGDMKFLMLRKHNLESFQESIPYKKLTATFREAMEIS